MGFFSWCMSSLSFITISFSSMTVLDPYTECTWLVSLLDREGREELRSSVRMSWSSGHTVQDFVKLHY